MIGRVGRGLDSGLVQSVKLSAMGFALTGIELIEVEEDLGEYRFVAFLGNRVDDLSCKSTSASFGSGFDSGTGCSGRAWKAQCSKRDACHTLM